LIAFSQAMKVTKCEHGCYLVQVKDEVRHFSITIWDKNSLSPLGKLLSNQRFTGDLEAAKKRAVETYAAMVNLPANLLQREMSWDAETVLSLASK
jgi:hypothetical protein